MGPVKSQILFGALGTHHSANLSLSLVCVLPSDAHTPTEPPVTLQAHRFQRLNIELITTSCPRECSSRVRSRSPCFALEGSASAAFAHDAFRDTPEGVFQAFLQFVNQTTKRKAHKRMPVLQSRCRVGVCGNWTFSCWGPNNIWVGVSVSASVGLTATWAHRSCGPRVGGVQERTGFQPPLSGNQMNL